VVPIINLTAQLMPVLVLVLMVPSLPLETAKPIIRAPVFLVDKPAHLKLEPATMEH